MVWLMVGSMGEDNLARMVLRERLGLGHRHRHSYIKVKPAYMWWVFRRIFV